MDGDHLLDGPALGIGDHELGGVPEGGVDDRVLHAFFEGVGPVDDVLADVVDPRLHPALAGDPAGVLDRSGAHQGAARTGGLAGAEVAGGVDDHRDLLGIDSEFFDGNLERHGVDALAHLGPAVADFDAAVLVEADHGSGDLEEPVAEPGVLEGEAHPDRLARGASLVVGRLDGVEAFAGAAAAVVHDLARSPDVAGFTTLRSRISQPLMPTWAANRSRRPSEANWAWLAPKPRKAPHTGLLVRTAIASTSTLAIS